MNLTGKILEIRKEVSAEKKRLAIFLGIFIAIYLAAGYFFELDIKLMIIIGIPVLFLGMMLTDIAHKIYASMLTNTMMIGASSEEVISTLKKEIKSERKEYKDEYEEEDYEEE